MFNSALAPTQPLLRSSPSHTLTTTVLEPAPWDSLGTVAQRGAWLRRCLTAEDSRGTQVRLERTEILYMCGQADDNIYVVQSGRIKTSTIAPSGKGCLVDIHCRDDLLGESCLTLPDRMETATAMTPAVVHRVSRQAFLTVLTDDGLLEESLRYFTGRLVERQHMITQLVTADSERRLASTLLWLGTKLGVRHDQNLLIEQRITQAELAEMVGTTRSRIGYFLKNFRRWGLIGAHVGYAMTLNVDRLNSYLNTCA